MTIKEVETQVEKKFSEALKELKETGGLEVLPEGYCCKVRIHGESRKKRQSASFEKSWSPERDSIQITFEPNLQRSQPSEQPNISHAPSIVPNAAPESVSGSNPIADLIKALDRTESQPGLSFVALKWFRDAVLPSEDFAWANADSIREVLGEAIAKRLILTSKVPNPRSPQFPTTAIRLNRLMPEVKMILGSRNEPLPDFQPVSIRGEELSATILRERR